MSEQQRSSLAEYPGYFPPGKGPFWTRLKVGLGAGLLGVVLGAAGAADGGEAKSAADEPAAGAGDKQALIDSAVDEAVDQAVDQARDEEAEGWQTKLAMQKAEAAAELRKARADARTEIARVRREARRAQRLAVREAVAEAEAEQPAPQPLTGDPGQSTDPQFSYCYEANDAGYGNYVQGVDPEYEWYDDADHDGVVCEF